MLAPLFVRIENIMKTVLIYVFSFVCGAKKEKKEKKRETRATMKFIIKLDKIDIHWVGEASDYVLLTASIVDAHSLKLDFFKIFPSNFLLDSKVLLFFSLFLHAVSIDWFALFVNSSGN